MTSRQIREHEKQQYLAASPYTDAPSRWRHYEDLIIFKYLPAHLSKKRLRIKYALDISWRERDRHHAHLGQKER